jgi:LPS export ABC transporter protein LptC
MSCPGPIRSGGDLSQQRSGRLAGQRFCPPCFPSALLALAAAFVALGGSATATSAQPATRPGTAVELTGMTYVGSRGGEVEMVLAADRADYRSGGGRVLIEDVHLRVVEREGVAGFELRSERGSIDLSAGDFEATGDVWGRTPDGRELRTQRLDYRHAAGLLRTDSPVEIRDAIGLYRGAGFEYHVRDARFRILGGASVTSGRGLVGEP